MSRPLALSDYLASMDQLEKDLDRSTRAIERCIHHLTEIEGRVRRDQLARSQAGWPGAAAGSAPRAQTATAARDRGWRLRNG